jgi:hypothetical protein
MVKKCLKVFIPLLLERHLGYFQWGAIMKNSVMNIWHTYRNTLPLIISGMPISNFAKQCKKYLLLLCGAEV